MRSVLLAGGGTAGHIEPALAVADALLAIDPTIRITALGTERGLETTLVPARGYELRLIPAVPLPRKPSKDLLTLPGRMRAAIKATRAIMAEREVDVVVGFGGYVALPAYLAARGRVPIVIHEANATAGLANKIGARFAVAVAAAVEGSGLKGARVVGNPVRRSLSELDRAGLRAQAREFFGLDPDAPTLLVFGGSQGAQRINAAVSAAAPDLAAAGIGVLHAYGRRNEITVPEAAAGSPAVCRGAVPGPDGPGLRGGRPGDGPVGCDDRRRDRRGRPAGGLRAAAARQRRAAAERVRRRSPAAPRSSSTTPTWTGKRWRPRSFRWSSTASCGTG